MNHDRLEPLDDDLDALLQVERSALPPPAALARVRARVAFAASAIPMNRSPLRAWIASHAVPVAAAAFIAGAAGGAALGARARPRAPERIVYMSRLAPPPGTSAPAVVDAPIDAPVPAGMAPTAPPVLPDNAPPARAGAPPSVPSASSLSAERLLIDEARSSLIAGEPARALALLSQHERRFHRPLLGEEREAIAIQALAASGRYDEARARAGHFRATSPDSLFLPAVEATLGSIP